MKIERPDPLTVGELLEVLGKIDPSLPIFTHANNHRATDNMCVALVHDAWFRVDSGEDFGNPPTRGVLIGNFGPTLNSGELIFDMWSAQRRNCNQENK